MVQVQVSVTSPGLMAATWKRTSWVFRPPHSRPHSWDRDAPMVRRRHTHTHNMIIEHAECTTCLLGRGGWDVGG